MLLQTQRGVAGIVTDRMEVVVYVIMVKAQGNLYNIITKYISKILPGLQYNLNLLLI